MTKALMPDCIFCKIVTGEISSRKIYEDDKYLAFLDIAPVTLGHTLIIPKKHSRDLLDTEESIIDGLISRAKKIAKAVVVATGSEAFNLSANNGEASGQEVFHLHFHIIPRKTGDSLSRWPRGSYETGEAEKIANLIKGALV